VWRHNFDLVEENSGVAYLRTLERLADT